MNEGTYDQGQKRYGKTLALCNASPANLLHDQNFHP
jgi:hypothetical protein